MIQQTTRGFDKRGLEAEQPKLKFGDDTDFAPLLSKPEELLRWMTPARTAELLGFTRNTIYQLIRKGEIPAIKIGGRQFIDADALSKRMRETCIRYAK